MVNVQFVFHFEKRVGVFIQVCQLVFVSRVLFNFLAGIIGSVTHYPKDMSEGVPEVKGDGYQTL